MVRNEVERIRRLIDGLRRDRRTHPYHDRREYSARANEVAVACHELIGTEPTAVPALLQRAVERVTATLMYMDDSAGIVGDNLRGLMAVHAHACMVAPPDAKRLATWLVKLRLDGPGWPDFELRDYADALGDRGRREIARLLADRATAADPDPYGCDAFGIRIMREQLAETSGDVDEYVAVLAESLHSATQYLKIVDAFTAADRHPDAEQWAARGLGQRGIPEDVAKLRDVYVDLLLRRGATTEAMDLRRKVFDQHPTRRNYADLRRTASMLEQWDGLRGTAIERLYTAVAEQSGYADELITVLLLDEDDLDQAWQVAGEHPDSLYENRSRQLIELRQPDHPAEVIAPLQRLIENRLTDDRDKHRYDRAVKLLRQLRGAYRAAGKSTDFDGYQAELRDRHKRKTSLIAKLDRTGF
ncbi:hypothetical protein GL305_12885 [Nocardia seriolae]|uniref:DUF6880 family protein n=1 Tax=Nocardia seriolae TaxID=37332 RepID=UPI0012BCB7A2|nr:DUF6880 family protein [Nocardia seriolae]MTK30859.1 hypothetical protein [Nocardia seriolae]